MQLTTSNTHHKTSGSTRRIRQWTALALLALLAGAPVAQAKFNWKAAWGVLSTIGGVGVGVSGNPLVGGALISLQGTLLSSDAATEGTEAASGSANGALLNAPGPVTTEPARQALIREYPLLDLSGDPQVDYFLQATNEVIESLNVLVRSRLAGAPAEQLRADLYQYGVALEQAAVEYDRLEIHHTISQADVDAFQQDVSINGLPAAEAQFLAELGFTPEEAEAFAMLISTAPVHLSRTVTPGEVLHAAAASITDVE